MLLFDGDLTFSWRFAEELSLPGHTVCCCASSASGRFEITTYFPYILDF